MSFQIQKIVLYSLSGQIRVLELKRNAVNIITGESKTGKSALIHIIDYCLGRKKCTVPQGIIHDNVSWFGLHLIRDKDELFIARRNPYPTNMSSEEIYLVKGTKLEVPAFNELKGNINTEGLVPLLSTFTNITAYEPDDGLGYRKSGSADIRKALTYCFQEQSEVANQYFLFHRQGEEFRSIQIKDYLPFFLGAVNKEYVLLKEELRSLKQERRKLEAKKAEANLIRGNYFSKAHALIEEAISLGVIPIRELPESWQDIKVILCDALGIKAKDMAESQYTQELNRLFDLKTQLRLEYQLADDEIIALNSLKSSQHGFTGEAFEHKARLKSIELLPLIENSELQKCSLCNSIPSQISPSANAILENLKQISQCLEGVHCDFQNAEKMTVTAEQRKADKKSQLNEINIQIDAIQAANEDMENIRDEAIKYATIRGKILFYLDTIEPITDDQFDDALLDKVIQKIDFLKEQVNDDSIHDKLDQILSSLSKEISEMAESLKLEHAEYPMRLNPRKLSVFADTNSGYIFLENMGSGENWVSLHLIMHLVLHRWFAKKGLPVPSFICFDQLTQVFYPPDHLDHSIIDTDNESVKRMFQLVKDMTQDAGFQVLITEHADIRDQWYRDMIIEKWRDGKKLIPMNWLK